MIGCRLLGLIWCLWLTVGALAGREGNVVRTRARRQLLSGMSCSFRYLTFRATLPSFIRVGGGGG